MLQLASTIRNRNGGSGGDGDNGQPVLLDYANADVDEIDGFQVQSCTFSIIEIYVLCSPLRAYLCLVYHR